ncbi:hypothetical protein BOTNAR_0045g00030 [Botryotinia narcissicola]|uniref:Uncharacterized protein n=1 Tax=Botryotinia narcissicola TaxID=278944 RepID=A0A4Z1J0T3_9HELO|nr:hypothetical protein BOTNAR_0045g00030 [Botryotinia narcissicola]
MSSRAMNLLLPELHVCLGVEVGDMATEIIEVSEGFGDDDIEDDVEETKVVDLISVEELGDSDVDIDVGMVERPTLLDKARRLTVVCEKSPDLMSPVEKRLLVVSEHVVGGDPEISAVVMMIGSVDVVGRSTPIEIVLVLKIELLWLATMIVVQRQLHEDAFSSFPKTEDINTEPKIMEIR